MLSHLRVLSGAVSWQATSHQGTDFSSLVVGPGRRLCVIFVGFVVLLAVAYVAVILLGFRWWVVSEPMEMAGSSPGVSMTGRKVGVRLQVTFSW